MINIGGRANYDSLPEEIRGTRAYMDHLLEDILHQAKKMAAESERQDSLHRARMFALRDRFEELVAEYAENKMKVKTFWAERK